MAMLMYICWEFLATWVFNIFQGSNMVHHPGEAIGLKDWGTILGFSTTDRLDYIDYIELD